MTTTAVFRRPRPRKSFKEVWLITIGHSLTHWYPATFYLLLPLIGNELGLSYLQIGSILTTQAMAGAISNIPGGLFVEFGRPQGTADGGLPVLDRRALPADGLQPRLLAAADLRRAGRHRQQPLASDRDPAAGAALSRPQGAGRVDPRHGRQCRRRARAAGRRRAAGGAELAPGRDHQRDPRHRDVGGAPGPARPHADRRPGRGRARRRRRSARFATRCATSSRCSPTAR